MGTVVIHLKRGKKPNPKTTSQKAIYGKTISLKKCHAVIIVTS